MRAAVVLLLSSVAWLGCHISAEVETIEWSAPLGFPGAGTAGMQTSLRKLLKLELGNSLPKIITELELRRAVVRPATGVSKLDFISSVTLTAIGDPQLPDMPIARFDKGLALGAAGQIDALVLPIELAPYIQRKLPVEVATELVAPEADWSIEIILELRAVSDGKL